MDWNSIFTEYDKDIVADANRDPLGIQVIWSAVGQDIFGRNITSISTSIRNFTINLLHHYFLAEIESSFKFILPTRFEPIFNNPKSQKFKAGGIIFLENLLALTACSNEEKIETGGILGSSIAFSRLSKDDKKNIEIEWDQHKGLLVRQIGLGINGRYKTPFVKAKLMDRHYRYATSQPVWNELKTLLTDWREASVLFEIFNKITNEVFESRDAPLHTLGAIHANHPNLIDAYSNCIGSVSVIPSKVREFWKRRLSLNEGAAGALYRAISQAKDKGDNKELVSLAQKESLSDVERKKLEHITEIEPFLSSVAFLFDALLCRTVGSIKDLEELYKSLGHKIDSIPKCGNVVKERISRSGKIRLGHLLKIDYSADTTTVIARLLDYHTNQVMSDRGGSSWCLLKGNGDLRKSGDQLDSSVLEQYPPSTWRHDYYLSTLRSLYDDLEAEK